ncbi:hypothetical protein EV356DRAFT_504090 [Viridothelium virens]|uniref:DUF4211 domain-containing protein n=1 Tax=Viridothelium virens TaxID=1048519 RepID=A0A6A6HLN3_VIRVR|nr:hypothetical protein EV356DRAFT_504090 [Viridothelium virens]
MMGPAMKSSRPKRQTRLTFSPLPSSSPQSSKYPPQIRDRAAAVAYEGSPSPAKRRKIDKAGIGMSPFRGNPIGLATPQKSSQTRDVDSDSDSEPVRKSSRKVHDVRAGESNKKIEAQQSGKPTYSSPLRSGRSSRGIFGTKHDIINLSSEEDSSSSAERNPGPSMKVARIGSSNRSKDKVTASGTSERLTRSKAPVVTLGFDSEDEIESSKKPPLSSALTEIGEAETSGDEITVRPEPRTRQPTGPARSRRAKKRADGLDDFIVDGESSSNPDSDVQVGSRRSRPQRVSAVADEDNGQDEDNDEEENEDGDDDDVPITPRKRRGRLVSKSATPRKFSRREREDLKEDLEFLQSSDDDSPQQSSRIRRRNEATPKQSARAQALATLKKRRAGKKIAISSDADSNDDGNDDGSAGTRNQEERGVNFGNEYNSEELDDPAEHRLNNGVPYNSASAMFEENEDDEGFVMEDEEDTIGAPTPALPLQFSGLTSRKPKELFKYAIEWFVQKKFNPAFQMDDDVYRLTFGKLDDEVKGLAGSKFISSAWTAEFTTAVQARPQIEAIELPKGTGFLHDKCDACNRSGHPATWQVRFTGKPYDKETLEDLEQDYEDEEEDDNDDDDSFDETEAPSGRIEYDSKGRVVPRANKTFELGKFCMRNAQISHALEHWRYHLNEWVIDYLRDEGYLTPDKIVERDGWKVRKRRNFANSVVDEMEDKGEIKRLYRDYRTEIDSAREARTDAGFARFGS